MYIVHIVVKTERSFLIFLIQNVSHTQITWEFMEKSNEIRVVSRIDDYSKIKP
jgi:hypothetical protein